MRDQTKSGSAEGIEVESVPDLVGISTCITAGSLFSIGGGVQKRRDFWYDELLVHYFEIPVIDLF
ncbi:hypothetical protein [Gimesia fumaroli]|nr:hypothetical protein [Gimesia fumaroli]